MASLALYRKYRPQTFGEVIGQEHVTRTLRNALRDGRIVHAYLFAGPRGTGKTSTARLLAKAVNCLEEDLAKRPCNQCTICRAINDGHLMDLIEIDAASNRGIDEIREIREKVNFRPNEARYKVYVVDEVHMLTEHAFNALLKTLEEPPPHAIFVLATTDPQKIPATVVSRCQRFEFRRIPLDALLDRLQYIAGQEGIEVDAPAMELIARQATGSVRDAVSLLDQLVSFGGESVALADVEAVLGAVPATVVAEVAQALLARDLQGSLRLVDRLAHGGTELGQFTKALVEYLRGLLLLRVGGDVGLLNRPAEEAERMQGQAREATPRHLLRLVRLFQRAIQDLKEDLLPQIPVELACVEACLGAEAGAERTQVAGTPDKVPVAPPPTRAGSAPARGQTGAASAPRESSPTRTPAAPAPASPDQGRADTTPTGPAETVPPEQGLSPAGPAALNASGLKGAWGRVLAEVRPHSRQVEAMLRGSCEPLSVEDGVVTIGFYHEFHKGQVEEQKNRELVQDAISQVLGTSHRLRCVLTSRSQTQGQEPAREPVAPEIFPPPPQEEKEEKTVSQEPKREELEGKYQAVAQDPLIQEAINRYGAQVVDIDSQQRSGQQSVVSGDEAPETDG